MEYIWQILQRGTKNSNISTNGCIISNMSSVDSLIILSDSGYLTEIALQISLRYIQNFLKNIDFTVIYLDILVDIFSLEKMEFFIN